MLQGETPRVLDEFARKVAKPIGDLPSNFMLDPSTYEYGSSLGFDGLDFYVRGRGGVLGEVPAAVVSAAFIFFEPGMIEKRWRRASGVMSAHDAALQFASRLHAWTAEHLAAEIDYALLCRLLGRAIEKASPAGAPLFAGWAALPEPLAPAELAMHRLNALRELRGALHGAAVLAVGLDPLVALLVKTPFMARVFGWEKPYPDVELATEAWAKAEAATDRAMGHVFGVLAPDEQDELGGLLNELHAAVH